jgi:hypothetical protein
MSEMRGGYVASARERYTRRARAEEMRKQYSHLHYSSLHTPLIHPGRCHFAFDIFSPPSSAVAPSTRSIAMTDILFSSHSPSSLLPPLLPLYAIAAAAPMSPPRHDAVRAAMLRLSAP